MQVTLEFLLANGDMDDESPIPSFEVNDVGALAAVPLPGDNVRLFKDGTTYGVLSRTFSWFSPTRVHVDVLVEPRAVGG